MNFRYALIALPLLVTAPVFAQDVVFAPGTGEAIDAAYAPEEYYESNSEIADVADRIDNPAMQDGVAATIEGVTTSAMHLPVGRFADAIERARPGTVDRRLPRDARVGDLAGRNAQYLPQELGDRSREAMAMMGGFARALAVMMPEFERMGRDMEDSFRAAKADAQSYRD